MNLFSQNSSTKALHRIRKSVGYTCTMHIAEEQNLRIACSDKHKAKKSFEKQGGMLCAQISWNILEYRTNSGIYSTKFLLGGKNISNGKHCICAVA